MPNIDEVPTILETVLREGNDIWSEAAKRGIASLSCFCDGRTDNGYFIVSTKTRKNFYHTIVYNLEAIAGEDLSCRNPLEIPGYIFAAKTTSDLRSASRAHSGMINYLNELGY